MALASTILDRAENTLIFERSTIGISGLESSNLLTVLNTAVKDYFMSFEKSGEPPSTIAKETGFALVADTALAADTAKGATSYTVDDSSDLGSSGALAIWDNDRPDYTEFTGNDLSTAITGATGLDFPHEEDDTVSLLYALPTGYDSMRSTIGFEDGVSVDGNPYFFTTGNPTRNNYAIYDNGTTKYLHFPQGVTGDVFVKYNGLPTVVDAETDTVDIPTKDEDYAMWRVVEYAAPMLERMDMYQIAQRQIFDILHSAHVRRNIGKRPKTRMTRTRGSITRSQVF